MFKESRRQRQQRWGNKGYQGMWGIQRGDNREVQTKQRERLNRVKNRNERKRGGKQREARKSEMWAIHKQTCPRDLGPAHLLLFTSEEIDTVEERLLAPGQNHCSAKLETGRTVGKAQTENALPTWTQYTAAWSCAGNPKPNSTILCPCQQTGRSVHSDSEYSDSLQCPSLDDGILQLSKYCPF